MKKKPKVPEWAEFDTVLEGVEKMEPVVASLKAELLAGQKAKKAGKPKRVSYHMRRIVAILYNLDGYFWQPMFSWAQMEDFQQQMKRRRR